MKNEWKRRLEEMELQLALGKAEGRKAFEEQKLRMKQFINDARTELSDLKVLSEDQRRKWQTRLEEAEVQLALGRAESKDAFLEQQSRIEETLKELQNTIREGKSAGDDRLDQWRKELVHNLQLFRLKLEIYKVHFAFGQDVAEAKIDAYRNELKNRIAEAREKLEDWKEDSEDRWEEFSDDMKSAAEHFNAAFKRLFA